MRLSRYRALFGTANGQFDPHPQAVVNRRIAEALQRPPRVPQAPEIAVPAVDGTGAPARADSSCDFTLELRPGSPRLLLNGTGDGEGEPIAGRAVLIWAPL